MSASVLILGAILLLLLPCIVQATEYPRIDSTHTAEGSPVHSTEPLATHGASQSRHLKPIASFLAALHKDQYTYELEIFVNTVTRERHAAEYTMWDSIGLSQSGHVSLSSLLWSGNGQLW